MTAPSRPRPPISFDDPSPPTAAAPSPGRRVDRAAAQAVAERHGFNRSVTVERPQTSADETDGRSLRRTGRTTQMNVKVRKDVRARYIALAKARGDASLGELLEDVLTMLEEKFGPR